jgi:hypothetical protein
MIEDFSTLKSQLKELAPIINEFKSEQVQLCLIEIIFNKEISGNKAENKIMDTNENKENQKVTRKKQRRSSQPSLEKNDKKSSSRKGPIYYLSLLIDDGYFNQPRQINAIVEHLKDDKAIIYKANAISTALRRLISSNKLKRNKNAENQYEYEKAK